MSQETRAALSAAQRAGVGADRVLRVWRALPHERRLAVGAALALFVSLFLPWYQETVIATSKASSLRSLTASVTGWGAFSFVEAAVLLVAVGVLTLLFQRAEGRAFHIPGGDGGVITLAGGWTCALVVWRIFDKQGTSNSSQYATTWGIEWGIFVALAVAALLAYAGTRIRAAHAPEPPLPGEAGYDEPAASTTPASEPAAPSEARSARRARQRATPAPVPAASPGPVPAPSRVAAPSSARDPRRGGDRPSGWLSAAPSDADQRPAPPAGGASQEVENRGWSYRDHVGEDDAVTGEWTVSDFDYSRERSRAAGVRRAPSSPPGAGEDPTVAERPPGGGEQRPR